MARRDEYGRFTSDDDRESRGRYDDDDRSWRSRGRDDWDDDARGRGSSRRGFASMDPERQREIASMGGRASHGGRGREWEGEDDDRSRGFRSRGSERDWDYDDDEPGRGSSRRGFASMDRERQREFASMGGRASHGGRGREWDDDDDRRGFSSSRGRERDWDDDDERGRGSSRRGFAAMDPERQREIASMGGRASHGGRGRDWDDEDDRSYRSRGRERDDWDDDDRSRGSSRRGFAAMDPERQREIASMGGRASHGGR